MTDTTPEGAAPPRRRHDTIPLTVTKELLANSNELFLKAVAENQQLKEAAEAAVGEKQGLLEQLATNEKTIKDLLNQIELLQRDGLTGLLNRTLFTTMCQQDLAQAARRSFLKDSEDGHARVMSAVTFMVFDLDKFKLVNDTHGHLVGDKVLKDTATLLRRSYRDIDIGGRWGGEEFAFYLPWCPVRQAVARTLEVRSRLAKLVFGAEDARFNVTTTVGISHMVSPDDTLQDLFDRADRALYWGKEHGRDQLVVWNEDESFTPITMMEQLATTAMP